MFRALKLTPPHGWNAVVWDLAIVTVGVLIALGAQEVAEAIHWRGEVRTARAELRNEMVYANRVFAYRIAAKPCIARRLDMVETLAERAAKHAPVPRVGPLIPDIGNALNDNIWETRRASQTLAHFGDEELGLLGLYYLQLGNIRFFIGEEARDWGVLEVIEGDPSRLGPEDIAGIRVAIQHARFENKLIADIASDELEYSGRFGLSPPIANAGRLKEICAPLLPAARSSAAS